MQIMQIWANKTAEIIVYIHVLVFMILTSQQPMALLHDEFTYYNTTNQTDHVNTNKELHEFRMCAMKQNKIKLDVQQNNTMYYSIIV